MAGAFDDLIPKTAAQKAGAFDDLIPQAAPVGDNPPLQAIGDIGRLIIKGAAGGKEATPEDAADRTNALMAVGQRMRRGATLVPPQAPATPQDYQPFFQGESQEVKDAGQRAGWAGTAAEVGGAILGAGKVGSVVQGVGTAAKAAPVVGRVLASPFTAAAGTGAILGASQAQGTDVDKTTGAAIGAAMGLGGQALGNIVGGGVAKAAGVFNPKPNIPTREGIEAAKKAAYDQADQAGVIYTPQLFQRVKAEVTDELAKMGYSPKLQPKIAAVLEEIDKAGASNVTLPGVEVVRKIAGNAYDPGNKSSNAMMGIIKSKIDDAMGNAAPGEVMMGDAVAGKAALQAARKNAQIGFKLDDLDKAQEIAKLQTSWSGSGGNIDNNTRRKIGQALLTPGKQGGLTPDEIAAAEKVVFGSVPQNLTRLAGKLSPSGNGLMAALQAGAAGATGGASLPLIGVGMGAKSIADKMTTANVKKLADIIAAGGSKAATESAPNGLQRLAQSERERLARILMMGGISAGVPLAQ